MSARWVTAAIVGSLCLCQLARAERNAPVPRWGTPLPSRARSLKILLDGEPIFADPHSGAERRGAAQRFARLPIYAHRRASGCAGDWYLVGPDAWVCGDHSELDLLPPTPAAPKARAFERGLALEYFFVDQEGAATYSSLSLLDEGIVEAELEPGFAVGLLQRARTATEDPVAMTTHGQWVHTADLRPATPSSFHGVELENGLPTHGFGWIFTDRARVRSSPAGSTTTVSLPRLTHIQVLETRAIRGRQWLRIGIDQWIPGQDVRVHRPLAAPVGVAPTERWLDVDTTSQILTAYEGSVAAFATLTSTGKGRAGTEQATPPGTHRIWVKLAHSDMDNLEKAEAERYYAMQAVPWVMFFQKGYGLHGVYWHNSWGTVRSQGCVNLAPLDAQRLFQWARPVLPAGWSAVLPTRYDPGTLVVVR